MNSTELENLVLGTTAILAMATAGAALVALWWHFVADVVPLLESTVAARVLS